MVAGLDKAWREAWGKLTGKARYLDQQRERNWKAHRVLPASSRRVGVMGLGVLGRTVLESRSGFAFSCAGWSRSPQQIGGITCYAGADGLQEFLARTDIRICLLPLTDSTRGILAKPLFDRLPRGAAVVFILITPSKAPRRSKLCNSGPLAMCPLRPPALCNLISARCLTRNTNENKRYF